MSPTEREWGELSTKLNQAIHSQRNAKMILDGVVEEGHGLRAEVARLRVMLRTALSVIAAVVAALAWVLEIVLR